MLTEPKLITKGQVIELSDYQNKAVKAALDKRPDVLANLLILVEDWDDKRESALRGGTDGGGAKLYHEAGDRLSDYYKRLFS